MKKLLFVVVVVLVGWMLWRTLGVKDQPADKTEQAVPAATHPVHREEVTAGAKLNSVFPPPDGEYKLTFTQEKTGFAEASLSKAGTKVATAQVTQPGGVAPIAGQAAAVVPIVQTDRLENARRHMRRYKELMAQGKYAEAGKELEAIESALR